MWIFQKCLAIMAPATAYRIICQLQIICGVLALLLLVPGLWWSLVISPPDYQQGETVRILYLHVPMAFASLAIYIVMTFFALVHYLWHIKLADVVVEVAAILGAWCTFLCLITGSLWGKPTWGTYWIFDARLTSELVLLFIYLGIIALRRSLQVSMAGRACSLMTLIGCVNIPIVHYSVSWWNTLHQASSLSWNGSEISKPLLEPLAFMLFGFAFLLIFMGCLAVRATLLHREAGAAWVREISMQGSD